MYKLSSFVKSSLVLGTAIASFSFVAGQSALASSSPKMESTKIVFNGKVLSTPYRFVEGGTTYMPLWYVEQVIKSIGLPTTWNGTDGVWTVGKGITVGGVSPYWSTQKKFYISYSPSGQMILAPAIDAKDPSSQVTTTFVPIWYLQQVLNNLNVTTNNTWNGNSRTWSIDTGDYIPQAQSSSSDSTWSQVTNTIGSSQSSGSYPLTVGTSDDVSGQHAVVSSGVWQLQNGQWVQLGGANSPLAHDTINALALVDGTLMAGTPDRGLWSWTNGTWTQVGGSGSAISRLSIKTITSVSGSLVVVTNGNFPASGVSVTGNSYNYSTVWRYVNNKWVQMGEQFAFGSEANNQVQFASELNGDLIVGLSTSPSVVTNTPSSELWDLHNSQWSKFGGTLPFKASSSLALMGNNGTLLVSDSSSSAWSLSGGTWTNIAPNGMGQYSIISEMMNNNSTFFGTANGIVVNSQNGQTIYEPQLKIPLSGSSYTWDGINAMGITGGNLVVGTFETGVWQLNGGSWSEVGGSNSPLSQSEISCMLS